MRMCLNKNVIAGLAVAALAIYLLAPGLFAAALPLLILAACPLSMVVMMRMMSGSKDEGSSTSPADAELAELRSEVERLRHEQDARPATSLAPPTQN